MSTLRELRKALGLSQEAIAKVVGKSCGSIRSYEDGRKLPPEVMGKMLSLAVRAGLSGLANQIESEAAGLYGQTVKATPIDDPRPAESREERGRLHALLDYVLDSGSAARTDALREILLTFYTATRCSEDPVGDLAHDEFVQGPMAEYRVIIPTDFGDGRLRAPGDIVRLRLETASKYALALIPVEGDEPVAPRVERKKSA